MNVQLSEALKVAFRILDDNPYELSSFEKVAKDVIGYAITENLCELVEQAIVILKQDSKQGNQDLIDLLTKILEGV